jgi:PadR family transcriptional regulator, regulatory protein PadR
MIPSELFSGSLKTIILKLLKDEGPLHGYAITQRVDEISGGKIKLSYGALYPVLYKLEKEKVLVADREIFNNRIRVNYTLTKKGKSVVEVKLRELGEFIESLQKIVESKPSLNYA